MYPLASLTAFIIFCMLINQLGCEVHKDRPKIKSIDGDLILEPAYDKSVYIRLNGPESHVYLGDMQLPVMNTTRTRYDGNGPPKNDQSQSGRLPQDVIDRLESLETLTSSLSSSILINMTFLNRRVNVLRNRVRTLENLLDRRAVDECQSHPCENGGTCLNLAKGHYCLCPTNWKGVNCDEDVNECRNYAGTDLGCQNGATCINKPGSYECICKPGWYGLDCTRKIKDCSGGDYEMCGHGTCISVTSGDGIKCICNQGWTTNGTHEACLTDVNECEGGQGARCSVNPRVECINLPGSFKCGRCPSGYEGDGFSCYDIDECVTLPNGGCSQSPMVSCHNTIGSRICGSCPAGYDGDGVTCTWRGSCSINRGGCHPLAQCVETVRLGGQLSQCICPYGMAGDGIGLHGCYVDTTQSNITRGCEDNPCGANGICRPLRRGYTCICYNGYGGIHCERPNDLCSNNPCQNGGTCRPDTNSSKGFRCECAALYSGDVCQLHSQTCGGVLDSEEGSIIYPTTNSTYAHNVRCAWVIHTAPDKVINVTFSKFNLEYNPQCHYDFVQIHDGRSSASQLIGRFCGNTFPKGGNIISSHNNLYFWFRSDSTIAKPGFALHWTSVPPVCGGDLNATTHGHIGSPGSPGPYPPDRDCYWHLTTTLGKRIQLHFYELDIETHPNCSFDYLAIYDGEQTTDPLIGMYCNSSQPAPVQSAGSEMLLHFHSDTHTSGKGFQIVYAPIEGVPGCGGLFTTDRGELVSPSYDGVYLNNLMCEYKIKTRSDTKIRISYTFFSIEGSFRCRYDYLKIYDGPSADSPVVGKFCGKIIPNSFTSSSNTLYFIFKSDHTLASRGFKIKYESVCLKTLRGDSGIIKSPGYPISYPKQSVCEYIIQSVPGKAIQLSFQDFDIEDNRYYNCQYDHVEVRDGATANATLLGRFCGGSEFTPPLQTSSFNYMYLKFNSDMSITGRGFVANYTTIDINCGGIHREASGIINHPTGDSHYKNNETCSWMLSAPEGMHIKLTWNRFELEDMPNCNSDYVELIEIEQNNENNTLGKYCGSALPPALTTSTNNLIIKFTSDSSIRDAGFSLSYSFLDEKTHCGGLYVRTHGYIYSPGWPGPYEPNRDCTWTINVPMGQQVMLNISDFDLERPLRDKCHLGDYLAVRDGPNENSPLIGTLCGYIKSQKIISTSNNIYVRFHSDFYLGGKGFKIEWDGTIRGCGGTLSGVLGSISSPNYPQNYNENAECFYKIVTSSGSRIRISYVDLELEQTHKCSDDYVEIFDGKDSNSPSFGKHCMFSEAPHEITTSTNYAYIKFRSDGFLNGKGFLLNYNTICNNTISGSYGVIESPGYPDKYPPNANCLWTITVPKGNAINVTFTHFDLAIFTRFYRTRYPRSFYDFPFRPHSFRYNRIDQCEMDYVQYKEKSDANYSEKICGSTLPRDIHTDGNSLEIKFVSSHFFPHTGFRLEWTKHGCGSHIQRSSGSLSMEGVRETSEELECEWLIETPAGTSVKLTISDFYITESKNCTVDAIEIYNGQSASFPLLSKVCHRGKVEIQGSTNFMFVKLTKRSSLRDVYLESRFEASRSGSCGGIMESQSGLIYSKNYPKNYDNNLDCIWVVNVPRGHRIEFNFIDLDLYSDNDPDDCSDSIKIYDGGIINANYTYKFCPSSNRTSVVSRSSSLIIQFSTNDYGTAKGFKANFTMTCGSIIQAFSDGIISNHNFINNKNKNCTWTILAPDLNEKIKLTIQHLSLLRDSNVETNRHCPSSYLRVFDGDDLQSPVIDEYCGNKVPPTITSHGSALTIQLGTYTNNISGQFSAHYTRLSTACGGQLTSEEGEIASPNYPESYPVNVNCEWTLKTSPGNRVYITFENFNLDDSEGCNEDYLEIRENDGAGNLLGTYCGDDVPVNTTIGSKLYIKFHSDSKKTGQGFLLHYGFLHGNDIIGLHSGEIASPLYPKLYLNKGEYFWRITTKGNTNIALNIKNLEIHKHTDICSSKLIIYDGYDEDAPILEVLCGVLKSSSKTIRTSSTVAFIKLVLDDTNTGALFYIKWTEMDKNIDESNLNDKINCGSNSSTLVTGYSTVTITSPNYPETYSSNLNCQWNFESEPGRHLVLEFREFELEQTSNCFADYVSIYSSNVPLQWTALKENMCLSVNASEKIEASTFLKVSFVTDSSVVKKGFKAVVASVCGGIFDKESGVIEISYLDEMKQSRSEITCDWVVKVRPGRTIAMKFEHFNITNSETCNTYLILRNGATNDSPLLGDGKYCGYAHENRSEVVSTGNYIFVRYSGKRIIPYSRSPYKHFKLRYEEKNIECGVTSELDGEHPWEIISSPNYPSVPVPNTECIWKFKAPPGQILRIDFIERFDLEKSLDCNSESIEVRDGSTQISPLRGKYCGQRPGTTKTTANTMFIKYSTQITEPRNGFKANVSIDVCGGTIVSDSGEIDSPSYPHMLVLPTGTVCEWHIISVPKYVINVEFKDINLPYTDKTCETKITIEEDIPGEVGNSTLREICNDNIEDITESFETISNKIVIKLHYGKSSDWSQISDSRGFRLTFNSSRPRCGGMITAAEGFISTPGYPRQTPIRYCQWIIVVPDKSRRVKLEVQDINDKYKLYIYNDKSFHSQVRVSNTNNSSGNPLIYESTGNVMALYTWIEQLGQPMNRFKARFSSDEPAMCGGTLEGINGELKAPDLVRSYECEWQYVNNDVVNTTFKSIFVTINLKSSDRNICRYADSKVAIQSVLANSDIFNRNVCGNNTQVSYRLPTSNMKIKANQYYLPLSFNLKWKLQPCGGVIKLGSDDIDILNLPDNYIDTIECGWVLISQNSIRFELKLDGMFNLECSDEYLQISQGLGQMSILVGDYCKDKTQEQNLISSFTYTYVQYHSKAQNKPAIKLIAKPLSVQCGGYLTSTNPTFSSPNYPNGYKENQECTWVIHANLGYRVSLKFIQRFVIEDRVNCTKDAVIIYDWKDNKYSEIVRLCGRSLPPSYNSTSNKMKVVFRSDADINLDGFKAQWTPICGGNLEASKTEQILYSPGYVYNYHPLLNCHYKITAPSKKIVLNFKDFDIEGPYPDCKYDNVTITGTNNFVNFQNVYCGKESPPQLIASDSVELDLKTDRFGQRKGFKMTYSIYDCGGRVTDPMVISLDSSYSDDMNCTWFIEAPTNKAIILKFLYIDIDTSYDCYVNYVAVFEGVKIDPDKRLSLMCGRINSTTVIKSKGNNMLLQFLSETNYNNAKGFRVEVLFSYSEAVGCGGEINLKSTFDLKSPIIGNSVVYENYLDCHWNIKAPTDNIIKVEFTSFHIAPCLNVNQTAIGFSKCDCDFVELKDGLNPNSLVIGTYCGHVIPPILSSSGNTLSLRLSTDGELTSSGFEAVLSTTPSICGQSVFTISRTAQRVQTPGYASDSIPRGLHCSYYFDSSNEPYNLVHVSIKNLDLQPGTGDKCDKDRLVIFSNSKSRNSTIGKDFVWNEDDNYLIMYAQFYDPNIFFPKQYIFCGKKDSLDLYITGSFKMNILTSPEAHSKYKGVDVEVTYTNICSRNYTESQGRIQNTYGSNVGTEVTDCYTLITAPENQTISVYFISVASVSWDDKVYLEIFDGNVTSAKTLMKIVGDYADVPTAFSSGRHVLIHNHMRNTDMITFDLNYIVNTNGGGCGGKINNILGRVTSPFYPEVYRRKSSCEWELETPSGSRLRLHFHIFDLGKLCDQNYLSLVNRQGETISTYCRETPADFTSTDNYVKIVFTTTMNNGGTGWVADFVGIV